MLILLVCGCNRKADVDWSQDSSLSTSAMTENLWKSGPGASSRPNAADSDDWPMSVPWPKQVLPFYPDSRLFLCSNGTGLDPAGDGGDLPNPVRTLPEIHERYVLEFIRTPGFGMERYRWHAGEWVELFVDGPSKTLAESGAYKLFRARSSLADESHGGTRYPCRPEYDAEAGTLVFPCETIHDVVERRWALQVMRLIGLVKHKEAVVYLGNGRRNHSGRPDRISRDPFAMKGEPIIPTRKPDRFEADALVELRKGIELVAKTSPSIMRIVGAIRARKDCLKCHEGGQGALLGAFTYTLWIESPSIKPEHVSPTSPKQRTPMRD
jgi:hypothetical protein